MGELVVLRHGQTEWSRSGQHTGRTDLPLLPEGEDQARSLQPVLAQRTFVEIRTSPLARARRTAELAGLAPLITDDDLMEVDYGGWEGLTTPDISERVGHEWSLWTDGTVPGDTHGENLGDVTARVDRVLDHVRPLLDDGDVALVAHGHLLRVLTARWLRLAPEAGSLFALHAGAYGVLGHEHSRRVLTGWNLR